MAHAVELTTLIFMYKTRITPSDVCLIISSCFRTQMGQIFADTILFNNTLCAGDKTFGGEHEESGSPLFTQDDKSQWFQVGSLIGLGTMKNNTGSYVMPQSKKT